MAFPLTFCLGIGITVTRLRISCGRLHVRLTIPTIFCVGVGIRACVPLLSSLLCLHPAVLPGALLVRCCGRSCTFVVLVRVAFRAGVAPFRSLLLSHPAILSRGGPLVLRSGRRCRFLRHLSLPVLFFLRRGRIVVLLSHRTGNKRQRTTHK